MKPMAWIHWKIIKISFENVYPAFPFRRKFIIITLFLMYTILVLKLMLLQTNFINWSISICNMISLIKVPTCALLGYYSVKTILQYNFIT